MATKGPIPKRSEQRLGHPRTAQKADDVTAVPIEGDVEVPEPAEHWDPLAADWYKSLAGSGQSRFFEPSDWRSAHFAAEIMTRCLNGDKLSAQMVLNVWQMMTDLLSTEASRRRVRMEIERVGPSSEAPADVPRLDDYRGLLG